MRGIKQTGNYGKGVVELENDVGDPEQKSQEICERLRATYSAPQYVPPLLPATALEVHRLSQLRDVKLEQVLTTLEKDPLLAARVLKVASSPMYGGAPLQSLNTAVLRIGLRELGVVVWEVALTMRVFRSKHYAAPMDAIRRHSTAVAHVSRLVAKLTSIPLEYSFLCGLLHDVGAAALLLLLEEAGKPGEASEALPDDTLGLVLASTHAEASALIAKAWKLSEDMQLVLAHHHHVTIAGYAHPTAAIIAVAEALVDEQGPAFHLPVPPWDHTSGSALQAAGKCLGINDAKLESLRKDGAALLAKIERT